MVAQIALHSNNSAPETFQLGHWKTFLKGNETASTNFFSAFTFLHLLPRCHRGTSLYLPTHGISFLEGKALLQSILWFFELPISGTTTKPTDSERLLQDTPILRCLRQLSDLITYQTFSSDSLAALWDAEPPRTQHACLFRLLQDINVLLDIFVRLVCPVYGDVPFFSTAAEYTVGTTQDITLLSPFYQVGISPIDPTASLERPSIFSAIATWENRVNTYYRDIANMDHRYLLSVPSTVLPPSYTNTPRDTNRTNTHTLTPGPVEAIRQHPPPSAGGPHAAYQQDTTGKQGKQKIFCKAVRPILQYTPNTLAGTVNPAALLKTLRPTPKLPSVDEQRQVPNTKAALTQPNALYISALIQCQPTQYQFTSRL
jgi:hypothetical protein